MTAWTVDVEWDGRRWRFDDHPVDLREEVDILTDEPSYTPRRARVALPMGDVHAMLSEGRDLSTMRVIVRADDRIELAAGVTNIQPGRAHELSVLQVGDAPIADQSMLPPEVDIRTRLIDQEATQEATTARDEEIDFLIQNRGSGKIAYSTLYEIAERYGVVQWLNRGGPIPWALTEAGLDPAYVYRDDVIGRVYPTVFGRPGREGYPAAMAILVDATQFSERILWAGHATTPGRVDLWRYGPDGTLLSFEQENPGQYLVSTHRTDDAGRTVSEITSAANAVTAVDLPNFIDGESEYAVALSAPTGTTSAEGLPAGAPDVIQYLLSATRGVRYDQASFEASREWLRGYDLAGSLNRQASAWDILTRGVLPVVPARLVPTRYGVGIASLLLEPDAHQVRGDITTGVTLHPAGKRPSWGLTATSDGPVTAWRVSYSWAPIEKRYRGQVLAAADPGRLAASGFRSKSVESGWIAQSGLARRVGQDLVTRSSRQRASYTYLASPAVHGLGGTMPMDAGSVWRLTCSYWGLQRRQAMVTGRKRLGQLLQLTFTVLD